MRVKCGFQIGLAFFIMPFFVGVSSAQELPSFTTTVQLESAEPVLRITVDGAPLIVGDQEQLWELVDKDPDTDDFRAKLREGGRLCLETPTSAACHTVVKGKVALFIVHRANKTYKIQIIM